MIRFPTFVESDHSRGLCMVCRVLKDSLISGISGQVGNCNCNHSELLCLELTGKELPLLSGYTYSVHKREEKRRLHKKESVVRWVRSPLAAQPQQLKTMEWNLFESQLKHTAVRYQLFLETPHASWKGECLHKWQQTRIRKNVSLLP